MVSMRLEDLPEGVIKDPASCPLLAYSLALPPVLLPASHPADLPTVADQSTLLAPGPPVQTRPALLTHQAPATPGLQWLLIHLYLPVRGIDDKCEGFGSQDIIARLQFNF